MEATRTARLGWGTLLLLRGNLPEGTGPGEAASSDGRPTAILPEGLEHRDGQDAPDDGGTGGAGGDGGRGGGGGGGGGNDGGGDGDGDRPIPWVTIATFSLSTEAHLARLRLEAAEVPCVLVDEHLVSVNWLLSPAVGGIKLQVPEDQLAAAREALGGDVVEWDDSEAERMAVCRGCGVGEFAPAPLPRWILGVSVLLLGIPLLFLPRIWKCTHCGARLPDEVPSPADGGGDRGETRR